MGGRSMLIDVSTCYTAGGGRDPLDEVAALHAQFLTPKHLRKGKGGRQPAVCASAFAPMRSPHLLTSP